MTLEMPSVSLPGIRRMVCPVRMQSSSHLEFLTRPSGRGKLRAFLVDAHQRPIGWRQIKTNDIAELVDEQRIDGKPECLRAMRLRAERVPNPADRCVRKTCLRRHGPDRPMCGVLWRGQEGALVDGGYLIIINCPTPSWTGLIQ